MTYLRSAVLGLLGVALAAGILLPIYTDEVGWRFQERAGFDGVDKLYSRACGANTLAAPPFFMWPARWYSAFFNGALPDPFWVRVSGILYAFIFIGLLATLVRRIAPPDRRDALTIVGVGLMGLGVMPLLLVWSRPEQPILIALGTALLLAFPKDSVAGRRAWIVAFAVLACAIVALSYHVKALVLTPVFLACIWLGGWGGMRPPRVAVSALLVAAAWSAAHYWFGRLACPDDPTMAAVNSGQNVGLAYLTHGGGPLRAITTLVGNIDLLRYVKLATPAVEPMSHWLPAAQVTRAGQGAWRVAMVVVWTVALLAAVVAGADATRRCWRERRFDARLALAALLFATACGWAATQLLRNAYEATFVLPLLTLSVVLALAAGRARLTTIPAGVVATALPISLILVAIVYGPILVRAFDGRGFVPGQAHSLAVRGYPGERERIVAAGRSCGIAPGRAQGGLLLDEATYFAFMTNPLPDHHLGVVQPESRGSVSDPIAYLGRYGSSGVVMTCDLLPRELRRLAHRSGDYCCLAPPWR